jgi:hypothetical protein
MLAVQVLLHRPAAAGGGRVVVGHQAHHLVADQPAQVQLFRRPQPVADDQVDIAGGQVAAVVELARQRHQFEPHARRRALDVRHQRRQEQRVEVVAGGHAEGGLAGRGVEGRAAQAAAEQPVGPLQHLRRRLQQLQRRRGGLHAMAGAHQQRVTRQRTQPPQLGADGRLGAVQPQGRTRDAAFGDQGVQDPDEVEVDGRHFGPAGHILGADKQYAGHRIHPGRARYLPGNHQGRPATAAPTRR